jgi:hypothetical protein
MRAFAASTSCASIRKDLPQSYSPPGPENQSAVHVLCFVSDVYQQVMKTAKTKGLQTAGPNRTRPGVLAQAAVHSPSTITM